MRSATPITGLPDGGCSSARSMRLSKVVSLIFRFASAGRMKIGPGDGMAARTRS
jgi:hypothetical protein